jgi:Domain of unknown function (DUF932)
MMTIEQIKSTAPAIFATKPSPKMSDKYVFVPTMDILDNFQKQGWELSSVKQTGLGVHGVHELRLRNGGLPKVGDCLVEAIIRNSHNGMATFSVSAGLHRLVCSNGLTVPTSLSESFNLRHQRFDLDEVKQLTESFAERLPIIQSSVDRMMTKVLTTPEKIQFVKQAINTRWKTGTVPATLDVMAIMYPKREEDKKNDLWTVFNVVQENFIRGGLEYTSSRGRKTSSKGLKSIMAVNQVNTKLWDLAEQFSY